MFLGFSSEVVSALAAVVICLGAAQAALADEGTAPSRVVFRGGTVYDGTGAAGVKADVLVEGDAIAAIGRDIKADGATVLDATGLVVCPGFIDVHNHTHEGLNTPDDPVARQVPSSVGQGVTTVVVGMDGSGEIDMVKYAEKITKNPRSVNIARLAGHSAARRAVVGREQRPATPEELAKMAALVDAAMKNGAFGLSSGLEYLGDYVTTEEVIALAKSVAPYGGYYETHLRNEDITVFEATQEAIRICREAGGIGLSISHIKVGSYEVWHRAGKLLKIIDDARAEGLKVYANWRSSIQWASDLRGFDPDNKRDLGAIDREIRKYYPNAEAYCFECSAHPEFVGQTLDKIAASMKVTPAEALVKIWDSGGARFEYNAMTWEDKKTFLLDPYCMVSSDGADGALSKGRKDPMIWSCFPIFFDRMVREWRWVPMETAVYKCTGLPAEMLGLKDRGRLAPGMKADIAVFDPKTIAGEEHWDKFDTLPTGIAYTVVNGVIVMDHGKHTGALPGRMLLRK